MVKNIINQKSTATNEKGYFEIDFYSGMVLLFTHINYQNSESLKYEKAIKKMR